MRWMESGVAWGACIAVGAAAYAIVTVDANGFGFVGKGDVQDKFGWNNQALQACAPLNQPHCLEFRLLSVEVSETSWECVNTNNDKIQERTRTTTTTTNGIVSGVAREKKQVTGFNLNGFAGIPVQSIETDGPALESCPSGPWVLVAESTQTEVVESSAGLKVSAYGGDFVDIP
jgi:hypothetical protein